VAVLIAQGGQDGNQGCYRVRGRSAVLTRVQFTGGGRHLHVHVHHSTQSSGQGGLPHPHVPGVLDEDRIGGEFLRVLLHVLLQPGGALLLGSFDHHGERDGDLSGGQQGAQCGQLGDDAAFAVGGAAAVVATLVLGQGERIGAPVAGVGGGLDVVVGVEQHPGRAGRAVVVADDGVASIGRGDQAGVLQAEIGKSRTDPFGS